MPCSSIQHILALEISWSPALMSSLTIFGRSYQDSHAGIKVMTPSARVHIFDLPDEVLVAIFEAVRGGRPRHAKHYRFHRDNIDYYERRVGVHSLFQLQAASSYLHEYHCRLHLCLYSLSQRGCLVTQDGSHSTARTPSTSVGWRFVAQ